MEAREEVREDGVDAAASASGASAVAAVAGATVATGGVGMGRGARRRGMLVGCMNPSESACALTVLSTSVRS